MSVVLKDLSSGTKKFIKCDDVKYCHAPQYEGLSLECILDQANRYERVSQYLPDERDIRKLPRQFVLNVVYSCVGGEFQQWVDTQVSTRNQKFVADDRMMIELDPEVAKAFAGSTAVSIARSRCVNVGRPGVSSTTPSFCLPQRR